MDLNASLAVKGKASTLAAANLESAIECGHTSPYSIIWTWLKAQIENFLKLNWSVG